MGAKIREQRFRAGDYLELNIYPVFECRRSDGRRRRNRPSKDAVKKINQKNRENEVNRILVANFSTKDYYVTLSYKSAPDSEEQVRRDVRYFIDKLNRRRASQGLDKAKYVKIIERGSRSGRYHIHLVISGEGITPALIAELWGKGYVDCKPLQFSADGLKGLARYFTKDKQEGGDKEGSCRHSWSCSRNCVRPQPRTNDHKYSKRAVRSMVEENAAEKVLRAMHPDYILADCETYYRDETGLYYIYAIMYRKDTKLNI
jgi:hypothetical protein